MLFEICVHKDKNRLVCQVVMLSPTQTVCASVYQLKTIDAIQAAVQSISI